MTNSNSNSNYLNSQALGSDRRHQITVSVNTAWGIWDTDMAEDKVNNFIARLHGGESVIGSHHSIKCWCK